MADEQETISRTVHVPILITPFENGGKCRCCPNGIHSYMRVKLFAMSYTGKSGLHSVDHFVDDFLHEHAAKGINGRTMRITLEILDEASD